MQWTQLYDICYKVAFLVYRNTQQYDFSVTSLFNHVLDDEEQELPQMFTSTFIDFIFKKVLPD